MDRLPRVVKAVMVAAVLLFLAVLWMRTSQGGVGGRSWVPGRCGAAGSCSASDSADDADVESLLQPMPAPAGDSARP